MSVVIYCRMCRRGDGAHSIAAVRRAVATAAYIDPNPQNFLNT